MSTHNFPLDSTLARYRLSHHEYQIICKQLGRPPQGVEWALYSALWSEHCSYKSSRAHLKGLYREGSRVQQAFGENAGVIDLGQGERIAFKIESHNHPSFIEPYNGAATGVGGILRDVFTMGARPIALANYLCFGEPDAKKMTSLVDGVVRGIGGYGNCVGVPTITGRTEFHSSYNENILVNAMAIGLFRPGEPICLSRAQGPGNCVVYVGAKTGRDGIHGASMASESFAENSESKRPTVQIGDPFYEKLLIEACLEVMQAGLVVAIQDMGAAGLTSSSFEMAAKGGVGFDLELDRVPLRDASLTPEDILLSESQERMLLIAEPSRLPAIVEIFSKWDLDAVEIGKVTPGPHIQLFWKGDLLTKIDPTLLTDHAPLYHREFQPSKSRVQVETLQQVQTNQELLQEEIGRALKSPQGVHRKWVYEQYDQRVGASTVWGCDQSIGVVRLKDSGRLLGVALGCRPTLMRADSYVGGFDAVYEPSLQLALRGFEPLAVTDCLNFGNPENPEIMTEFVASLSGLNAAAKLVGTPIISGNVSFYNESRAGASKKNITSTPSTGLVGLRDFGAMPVSSFERVETKLNLFLLGIPWLKTDAYHEASGRLKARGEFTGEPPRSLKQFLEMLMEDARSGRFVAARVVGKWGVLATLLKMAAQGLDGVESRQRGFKVHLDEQQVSPSREVLEFPLYSVVVATDSKSDAPQSEADWKSRGYLDCQQIGHVEPAEKDGLVEWGTALRWTSSDLRQLTSQGVEHVFGLS